MTFVHVQFDEVSRSFKILESDLGESFTNGGIYIMAVDKPGSNDLDSDSEWIFPALSKPAHA